MPVQQDQGLIKLISGRQTKLESDKSSFCDRMQDIADYVSPHREDIRGNLQPGEKKGRKIFDGTAVGAAVLATDGIHGYHVSPAFPWFRYIMNRKQVNKDPKVRTWLDESQWNMYMALNRSNFYSEMWMYIYDGLTIGTAPLYSEEDMSTGKIVFESIHPGEAYIAENRYGDVDIFHRKRKMSARQLVQMFGVENLTPAIKTMYETQPFTEFEIIHAVFPREEYDSRLKDAKNKRYASVWMLKDGSHICKISGYDEFPYSCWRYMRNGKEPYGISPAMLAMSDIQGLNLMSKTILGAAQLAVDPAYNIPAYLEGKVQLKPRGLNYMRDYNDRISPVNTGSNFPVGLDREQAKQAAIKERFHVDTFLMLSQAQGKGDRTAFEVNEMMAEKAAVLGAELGPLNTELDKILDRVYSLEVAAGRMPQPPDELVALAEQDSHLRFDPMYMGPLAQAQKERFSKDGIRKFFMDITPILQVKPDILDGYNLDAAGEIIAEISNIPAEMIRTAEERDEIRAARSQAIAQEQQKEDMMNAAEGVKTLASADKDTGGGLTQAVMQAAGGARA